MRDLDPVSIIARKRDGHGLSVPEIEAFVAGATDGSWADHQLSALLMCIRVRGMTPAETVALTRAMTRSGATVDLSNIGRPKVDKHSTGGVGDKVSLILAPLVASCGVAVPMISGRGLGHTGGTIDKLESIPGFRSDLSLDAFTAQVGRIGVAITGQSAELAPADRKLYELRSLTATVDSIPLICASIMSKKLAEGSDALVLDVKFGRGAFMADRASARDLAGELVAIGRAMGKPVRAMLTAMDQPLGLAVGNSIEVAESIEALSGKGPPDVMAVVLALGEQMLILAGEAKDSAAARKLLSRALDSGAARAKFSELVAAQGGDVRIVDQPKLLPAARRKTPVPAGRAGFVQSVDARAVAAAALCLGAGRVHASDRVDPAVGIAELVKIGARVDKGDALAIIHANGAAAGTEARAILERSIEIGESPAAEPELIAGIIE